MTLIFDICFVNVVSILRQFGEFLIIIVVFEVFEHNCHIDLINFMSRTILLKKYIRKKLIDKKSSVWIHHFLTWKSRPSVLEKKQSWTEILQLGKGRRHDPSGGATAARTLR